MNKQGPNGIGWCSHTWNPVLSDPEIRLDEKELIAPYKLKTPARIFCGSTIEMFHQDTHGAWLQHIIQVIKDNPQHVFQFLYHFSPHRGLFPSNCWLGLTVTSYIDAQKAVTFSKTYPNHIKFISFEPLLGDPKIPDEVFEEIDWVIIGALTGNRKGKTEPRKEWIAGLLNAADKHLLPVYMKDNLQPYWYHYLRKEFPKKK